MLRGGEENNMSSILLVSTATGYHCILSSFEMFIRRSCFDAEGLLKMRLYLEGQFKLTDDWYLFHLA